MTNPLERKLWFREWMPYCLTKLDEERCGKNVWLPLNRYYKPLGQPSDQWVDYSGFAASAIKFARDPASIEGVWVNEAKSPYGAERHLYLYSDKPAHRSDYFARLGKLMTHGKGWK
ncbi:hypothetical protein [Inquilinus limosus]|uniref:Uncharacterized protein n=1 Tax=Inquilinus limosus MP06 TaxID=1398085 RepID=A0A0A0D9X5_9PROT|nr:hypothetical protein [Inquilinus limosus]KGM34688.1 hypothetical protein P409_08805 [Inquilinus limosus MP06]